MVGSFAVLPDYPGSDHSRLRILPLPYAIYRGRTVRADNGGLRGRYRFTPDAEVDLSIGGALPASTRGDQARQGMPNLDLLLEVGPRLTITFLRPKSDASAGLELPVRAVFSTDFRDIEARGFVFAPEAFYTDHRIGNSAWRGRIGIGPVFATEQLMDYFYTVAPIYALPDRPAYNAKAGYLESRLNLAFGRDLKKNLSLFVFGRASSLAGATNADSPLLRRNFNVSAGLGVAYTFARSVETVPAEN